MKNQSTRIMGVINVSPESFYKGSIRTQGSAIAQAARKMTADGADLIDVGAMSTAPYLKTQISEKEEARRLSEAVRIIKQNTDRPISVDAFRSRPAQAGLEAGAQIINDVTGLFGDAEMPKVAKQAAGLILMANPKGAHNKVLLNPVADIKNILRASLRQAARHGIPRSKIILDPGIGFFRSAKIQWWEWDVQVLRNLRKLESFRLPILVGVSRKSFLGKLLGGKPPEERLFGSLGATVVAVRNGASIIRTHDVAATREAIRVAEALIRRPGFRGGDD